MKLFRRLRLVDKYQVELSREPDKGGKYVLFHITKSLRGFNYQRVFKGSYKDCHKEKARLENEKKENQYIKPIKRNIQYVGNSGK